VPETRRPETASLIPDHDLILDIDLPARLRDEAQPGTVDKGGNVAVPSRPGSRDAAADNVLFSFSGQFRRRRQMSTENGEMNKRIEKLKSFVVRDMLLRLRRQDIG